MSAALIGSGMGLGLGAAYLGAGMAGDAADHARAQQITDAAARGYAGSYLDARGEGLRAGLERYGVSGVASDGSAPKTSVDVRASAKSRRRAELECLTEAVYYEARGESARGQAAVAQVVMNRVKHPAFPKTVCGVVFQGSGHSGCQFSFTCDGSMRRGREAAAWDRARKVATRVLAGAVVGDVGSATHFHTTAVAPSWGPQMRRVALVGTHVFYKFAPRLRAPAAPVAETAVLISAPLAAPPELHLAPAIIEKRVEASLQPVVNAPATTKAAPAPAAPPADTGKAAEAAAIAPLPIAVASGS